MQFNPILVRESRVRWRGLLGFALMLLFVVALSALMAFFYVQMLGNPDPIGATDRLQSQRLGQSGHELFLVLCSGSTLAWMIMAPALGASSIAGERERGLLESLRLCPLGERGILVGKLQSLLGLLLLFLLVATPVVSIIFSLGGVSPLEFFLSLLVQLTTILTATSLGLCASAWSRNTNAAMRTTLLLLIVWGIGGFYVFWEWGYFLRFPPVPNTLDVWILSACSLSNSGVAIYGVLTPQILNGFFTLLYGLLFGVSPARAAAILSPTTLSVLVASTHVLLSLVLCALFLKGAALGLRRSFVGAQFVERRDWLSVLRRLVAPPENSAPTKRTRIRGALWHEVSLWPPLRLGNPILQRELSNKFRLRAGNWYTFLLKIIIGLMALSYFGLHLMIVLGMRSERQGACWSLMVTTLAISMLAAALMGALAFTREREMKTWRALRLSSLSPAAILFGKLFPALLACFIYALPIWAVLLFSVDTLVLKLRAGDYYYNQSNVLSLTQVLGVFLLVATSTWFAAALGLACSWLCRRTTAAVGYTLAAGFVFLVGLPWISIALLESSGSDYVKGLIQPFHPFIALDAISNHQLNIWSPPSGTMQAFNTTSTALQTALPLFLIGAAFLAFVYCGLRRDVREERANSPSE